MSLPLNALRVFVCVARRGSIQLAAVELCVTPGAVSRQIKALEDYLGGALFERRHRAIVPTTEALALLERLGPALDEIGEAVARVRSARRRPPVGLTIDATPTFAMYWLIPRLASFRSAFPEVSLRLLTSQGPVLPRADVDLHVRRDPVHFAGLEAEECLSEYALPVALPSVGKDWTAGSIPLIRMRSRPDLWPLWLKRFPVQGTPTYLDFDNTILAIQAACQGLGVALVPTLFLTDLLRDGVLEPTPGAQPLHSGSYHLLSGLGRSPAGSEFAKWLHATVEREEMGSSPGR